MNEPQERWRGGGGQRAQWRGLGRRPSQHSAVSSSIAIELGARQRLVQHHAQRVQVGAVVDANAEELLGGQVASRADEAFARRNRRVQRAAPGEPEVEQPHLPVHGHQHVLGLQIPMHHVGVVHVYQGFHQPDRHIHDVLPGRAGAAPWERRAVDVLHDDVGLAEKLPRVDELNHTRHRERAERLDLSLHPNPVHRGGDPDQLEGGHLPGSLLAGPPNAAPAPRTDEVQQEPAAVDQGGDAHAGRVYRIGPGRGGDPPQVARVPDATRHRARPVQLSLKASASRHS